MGIRYLKKYAALEGLVPVDDAEALSQWLQAQANPAVHLGRCEHLHAAVLQVLLVIRPKVVAPPNNRWLAQALSA